MDPLKGIVNDRRVECLRNADIPNPSQAWRRYPRTAPRPKTGRASVKGPISQNLAEAAAGRKGVTGKANEADTLFPKARSRQTFRSQVTTIN